MDKDQLKTLKNFIDSHKFGQGCEPPTNDWGELMMPGHLTTVVEQLLDALIDDEEKNPLLENFKNIQRKNHMYCRKVHAEFSEAMEVLHECVQILRHKGPDMPIDQVKDIVINSTEKVITKLLRIRND